MPLEICLPLPYSDRADHSAGTVRHKGMNALDGASSLHFVPEQVTPGLFGINGKAGSRRPVRKARAAMCWEQPVPVASNGPITRHG